MSYAVFFDVLPKKGFVDAYFGMANGLKPIVEQIKGFISVERFENIGNAGWYLSFSQWQDETALGAWRCQHDHHEAQVCGRNLVFDDYRLRVVKKQNEDTSKSCIRVIVGDFNEMKVIVENASQSLVMPAKLFRGVTNQHKGIAIFEPDIDSLPKLQCNLLNQNSNQVTFYEIQRDYGMFDRAQAPSVFA
jgi:heme-degrading monooxygenase HmoA